VSPEVAANLSKIAHADVVTEEGLNRLFEKKSYADNSWLSVNYVQSCVKDKVGVGKLVQIDFSAPISASGSIEYKGIPDMLNEL